jgi:hypothetical protein
MTRSRFVVFLSMIVVVGGVVVGLGALALDPARAAVGPLPAEGLAFPADARFVVGLDLKRLIASPFYQRYGKQGGRPDVFADMTDKLGMNPERDVDQVVIAGNTAGAGAGLVLVIGRFDRARVTRLIETEKRGDVSWSTREGTTVYLFREGTKGAGAAAFLDDNALLVGSAAAVEATIDNRAKGGPSLRSNAGLVSLLERVKPGSTFWMVGDQSLLAQMPRSIPAPGGAPAPGAPSSSVTLPNLRNLIVTGDLDPELALAIVGEASDDAAAKNLADVVRGVVAMAALQAGQKPELKDLASAVSVTTDANRVLVNARIPYSLLDALQPKKTTETAPQ